MKRITLALLLLSNIAFAQNSDSSKKQSPLTISAYVDAYYGFDFSKPSDNNRPGFLYSHARHNEFNINLAYAKANYTADRVRGNIALAVGTYMNANYAAEPGVMKNILEANVGYKISPKSNWWIDIGILPSHIGFESAISKDCWTLTRSMVAENSPYFESGAKLSYQSNNGKVSVGLLALNGWQRIKRVEGNSLMSWGAQLTLKPTSAVTFNYSNFIGTDKPDSARLWRIYHNLYGIWQINPKVGITAGLDLGSEQKLKGENKMNYWYAPVAIVRLTPTDKWAFALRGEYFHDENQVIIGTNTQNGFKTIGVSVNADYMPVSNISLRVEFRSLNSKDANFMKNSEAVRYNNSVCISTAIAF